MWCCVCVSLSGTAWHKTLLRSQERKKLFKWLVSSNALNFRSMYTRFSNKLFHCLWNLLMPKKRNTSFFHLSFRPNWINNEHEISNYFLYTFNMNFHHCVDSFTSSDGMLKYLWTENETLSSGMNTNSIEKSLFLQIKLDEHFRE